MRHQTHSRQSETLAKKRWEYLRAKCGIYVSIAIVPLGLFVSVALPVFTLSLGALLLALPLLVFDIAMIPDFIFTCQLRAKSLRYVPPVREQIANLPADVVLLRGSERPAATAEELLRATGKSAKTDTATVLRAGMEKRQ